MGRVVVVDGDLGHTFRACIAEVPLVEPKLACLLHAQGLVHDVLFATVFLLERRGNHGASWLFKSSLVRIHRAKPIIIILEYIWVSFGHRPECLLLVFILIIL